MLCMIVVLTSFFFQAEDGIRDAQESRGLGDVYKRQPACHGVVVAAHRGKIPLTHQVRALVGTGIVADDILSLIHI